MPSWCPYINVSRFCWAGDKSEKRLYPGVDVVLNVPIHLATSLGQMETNMMNNAAALLKNSALRDHVITIGQDFELHGGDIAVAVALLYYGETAKPKGYRRVRSVYLSKIFSCNGVTDRFYPLVVASTSLWKALPDEDWLMMALTSYHSDKGIVEAERIARFAIASAGRQLCEMKDDPRIAWRYLLSYVRDRVTGKFVPRSLMA